MTVKRAKFVILLFALTLVVGAIIAMRALPAQGVKRRLEAIRAAGLPTSGSELDVWYKTVPAKENRALLLVEAAGEFVAPPSAVEKKTDEEITPKYLKAVADHLEANKKVLEKLHGVPALPGSRYPVDFSAGFNTLLPHLAKTKSLVNFLKLDAEHQARNTNAAGAYRSLVSGFAAASTVWQEPVYISDLVGNACSAIMVSALEHVVDSTQLTDAQLSSLSTILAQQESEGLDGYFRGLVGERAIGISTFSLSFQEFQAVSSGGSPSGNGWLGVLAYQAYTAAGLRERDMDCYLDMIGRYVDSARTTFPEALRRSDENESAMQERFSTGFGRIAIFSRMLLPSLSKGTKKEAQLFARLRCAQMALAVERYRLEHNGTLPTKAEELSPKYLHKIPQDPFDGVPLLYEQLPSKGYRVVSQAATGDRKKESKNAEDVAFSVRR